MDFSEDGVSNVLLTAEAQRRGVFDNQVVKKLRVSAPLRLKEKRDFIYHKATHSLKVASFCLEKKSATIRFGCL